MKKRSFSIFIGAAAVAALVLVSATPATANVLVRSASCNVPKSVYGTSVSSTADEMVHRHYKKPGGTLSIFSWSTGGTRTSYGPWTAADVTATSGGSTISSFGLGCL